MRSKLLLLWGIPIYAISYLVWSGFSLYGHFGFESRVGVCLAIISTSFIAGRSLHFSTWKDVLPYSVLWLGTIVFLDIIYAVPSSGWYIFSDPNILFSYALITLVPLLAPAVRTPPSVVHSL